MFKKGITGKDSEMMTGKHLGPEPKKKKIEANQVCSSEETPLTPVGGSDRNCPVFLSQIWNIVWAPGDRTRDHQSVQRKEPRHARLHSYVIL